MKILAEQCEFIRQEFQDITPFLDERSIRIWCAARARAYNRLYGRGGVAVVSRATGISRSRIYTGIAELSHPVPQQAKEGKNVGS